MSDAKKPNDGGPAFPVGTRDISGMALRDYFAGQFLSGLGANKNLHWEPTHHAQVAYAVADAMLSERAKRGGE